MVFSSAIFLFYFLPSLILLYFFVPTKFKNFLLLSASLLFYAWGEGIYVVLMLLSIGSNYVVGLALAQKRSRILLTVGVSLNLAVLIFYKYANFLADSVNEAMTSQGWHTIDLAPVHLPLGISFFTFQAISYLVDLYRQQIPVQKNILNLGLYISLFPQLIAGPIVRYKTIAAQIDKRKVDLPLFASGVERFTLGLGKKMLIANPLGFVVDTIFTVPFDQLPSHVAWFGIVLYALQIYFDFSGYSDMAIGLGRIFGFRFLENFNYPYVATSVQEFWRRWHISLSSWFRDYLYIPLGGNRTTPLRTYCNLFIVFILCGLWHGASLNFLAWGAFHGAFLAIERLGLTNFISGLWKPVRHVYLIFVILISWVLFRAESLSDAANYLAAMFRFEFSAVPIEVIDVLNIQVVFAFVLGLFFSTRKHWRRKYLINEDIGEAIAQSKYQLSVVNATLVLAILALSIVSLASSTHNPFIYFRF